MHIENTHSTVEPMDGHSQDTRQKNVEALRKLFPNVFSEGALDWEKARAVFGDEPYFNDELKTNTALQMRDAGVEFRTI
jgi:hypothetical protein